jgi:hypothetical protein
MATKKQGEQGDLNADNEEHPADVEPMEDTANDEQAAWEAEDPWAEVEAAATGGSAEDSSTVAWARRLIVARLSRVPVMRHVELTGYAVGAYNREKATVRQEALRAALWQLLEEHVIAQVPTQFTGSSQGRFFYLTKYTREIVAFYKAANKAVNQS